MQQQASLTFSGPQYYDELLGPLWFGPLAADLANCLPADPGGDVLELACGTGLVTRHMRERLAASRSIVSTDFSKPMIEYARQRFRDVPGIDWQEADAMQLPFADARFGAVVCGLGLMFMPDRPKMLREARRVLMDGGVLLLSVWDRIEENPHAMVNADVVEALFPGDPEIRFRTPYELNDAVALKKLVEDAGFDSVRVELKRNPIRGADPQAMAIGQIKGTPRGALIEKKGMNLDTVIGRVAAALAASGGSPYNGHSQGWVLQARAA